MGVLGFCSDGSEYSSYDRRIDRDDDNIPFPLQVPDPIENAMQPALPVPLTFPVIVPGNADSLEAAVHINVLHCVHGHANEFLLRETAKSLGVELRG